MKNTAFNYVRMFRQRHGLNERELADLMGQRWHTVVSRIEGGHRVLSLRSALALQVLFRKEPRHLFPGIYDEVEDAVMRRAKSLIDQIAHRADPRSLQKLQFLEGLAREEDGSIEL